MKMLRDQDREVKFLENSQEILENQEKFFFLSVRFQMSLQIAYMSECKFALVAFS